MSGYQLRASKKGDSASIKSLMYFIDVLAILAFLFMIQSENMNAELTSTIEKQSESIIRFEQKMGEIGEADINREIEKIVRENQESKQKVDQILSQLDKAVEEKTRRNNEYKRLIEKLQLKNRLDVLAAEQKNADHLKVLTKEVEEKEEMITVISNEVKKQEMALISRETKISEVSFKLDNLRAKSSDLEQKISKKEKALFSLRNEYRNISQNNEQLKTSNLAFNESIVKTEKEIQDLKASLDQKTEKIDKLTSEHDNAVTQNNELTNNLAYLGQNYAQIKKSLAQTSKELVSLQKSNTQAENKSTNLERNLEGLLTKIVQLNSHLNSKNSNSSALAQQLQEKSKELQQIQADKEIAVSKSDELQKSVDDLVGKYSQISKKINTKNSNIIKLKGDINQLKSNSSNRNNKNEELESSLDNLVANLSNLNNQLKGKNQVEEELRKELQGKSDAMNTLAENNRQAKKKNVELESNIENLLEKVTKLNSNIARKTDRFDKLQKEIDDLKKDQKPTDKNINEKLIASIKVLEKGKSNLDKNIENQSKRLKKSENEKQAAQAKNVELEQSVDGLLDKANNMEKWLAVKNREMADLRKQYEALQKEGQDKEDINEDLIKKLQMMRKEKPDVVAKVQRSLLSEKLKELERFGVKVRKDGQVILPLTEVSFKRDSAELSSVFIGLLNQIVPKYSEIICRREEVCDMISEIKIAGFSSPVFKDQYIDPGEISERSRLAHDYNLDLSHKRATAILGFIKYNMQFKYKSKIVTKLTNVSAYGYLKAKKVPEQLLGKFAGCKPQNYNCSDERYVTISFHLPSDP